jgi:hypothetical protein
VRDRRTPEPSDQASQGMTTGVGGWETDNRPVPTTSPQRAGEEAGQQVAGQLGPEPVQIHICWAWGPEARPIRHLLATVSV